MTLDNELIALLYQLDDIAQALDRVEAQHGPAAAIAAARARHERVRRTVLALGGERLRYGATQALQH